MVFNKNNDVLSSNNNSNFCNTENDEIIDAKSSSTQVCFKTTVSGVTLAQRIDPAEHWRKLYATVIAENQTLRKYLEAAKDELGEFKHLAVEVTATHQELRTKLDVETMRREVAESVASKFYEEAEHLRRFSTMMAPSSGPPAAISLSQTATNSGSLLELRKIIDELTETVSSQQRKIAQQEARIEELLSAKESLQNDLAAEIEALAETRTKLEEREDTILQMKEVSLYAIDQRNSMKASYGDLTIQHNALVRQSTLFMAEVAADQKLMMAMLQLDEALKNIEKEKLDRAEETATLKSALHSKDNELLILQTDLDRLKLDLEALQNVSLTVQFADLEVKRRCAVNNATLTNGREHIYETPNSHQAENGHVTLATPSIAAPPPPPPPPPLVKSRDAVDALEELLRKRKALPKRQVSEDGQKSSAMENLIDEIRQRSFKLKSTNPTGPILQTKTRSSPEKLSPEQSKRKVDADGSLQQVRLWLKQVSASNAKSPSLRKRTQQHQSLARAHNEIPELQRKFSAIFGQQQ